MRHTLLPLNERKSLRRDYYIRLAIVLFFLVSLSGVVGIGALFPAYIHERAEEQTALDAAAQLKRTKDQSGQTAIENELRTDAAVLARIQSGKSSIRASSAIASVIALREAVKMTSLSFEQTGTTTVAVVMQGTAATREDLLSFKGRLESTLPESRVELPISELARSRDIQFSMRVTYNLP